MKRTVLKKTDYDRFMTAAKEIDEKGRCLDERGFCKYRSTKEGAPKGCAIGGALPDHLFKSGGGTIPDNLSAGVGMLMGDYGYAVGPYLNMVPQTVLSSLQTHHDGMSSTYVGGTYMQDKVRELLTWESELKDQPGLFCDGAKVGSKVRSTGVTSEEHLIDFPAYAVGSVHYLVPNPYIKDSLSLEGSKLNGFDATWELVEEEEPAEEPVEETVPEVPLITPKPEQVKQLCTFQSNQPPVYNDTGWGNTGFAIPLKDQEKFYDHCKVKGIRSAAWAWDVSYTTAWRCYRLHSSQAVTPLKAVGDFNKDFRMRACLMANQVGVTKAADTMGCSRGSIYNWLKVYKLTNAYFNPKKVL